MTVELPGNVISIEVLRENRQLRQLRGNCPHTHLTIHHIDGLCCTDCGKQLDPIGWIIERMEELNLIVMRERMVNEASQKLNERSRTKCRHCGQMTPISR